MKQRYKLNSNMEVRAVVEIPACPDCGVLLMFERRRDDFWCVKCKAYKHIARVKWKLWPHAKEELHQCPECGAKVTYSRRRDALLYFCAECVRWFNPNEVQKPRHCPKCKRVLRKEGTKYYCDNKSCGLVYHIPNDDTGVTEWAEGKGVVTISSVPTRACGAVGCVEPVAGVWHAGRPDEAHLCLKHLKRMQGLSSISSGIPF